MIEFRTVAADANKIRILRSTFSGTFLLVEGLSDRLFYKRFIEQSTCQIVTISGKPSSKQKVIAVLRIFEAENFRQILAIVDADFDRILPPSYNSPNLLRTDTRDLETLLLRSPALDKIVTEFVSEEKMAQFQDNLRTKLLEAGKLMGYLRLISEEETLNLKFDNLTFSKFVNEQTMKIDESKLIKAIQEKSTEYSLQKEEFQQKLKDKQKNNYDLWQLCCGHDLIAILSVGLRKVLRKVNESKVSREEIKPDSLERILRLAYEVRFFQDTQLYTDIQEWENINSPLQVLQHEIQR
ncbi:MAG: DUF4435 domain-containing protein [Cyanobacteria bacterium SBLK]|nr:DUF4435 domain-containing protein [Cyanobacteria bacterium SBLK]